MNDAYAHLANARKFATLLDSRWNFFGIKFGIDPMFDIVPGITPLITVALSCYLLYIAYLLKAPSYITIQMIANIVIDYVIGSVPVIGVVGDIFFRSNLKNLALLEEFVQKSQGTMVQEGTIVD